MHRSRTFLTIYNDPFHKAIVGRVGNDEKDIHEPDQSNLSRPVLPVDGNFPRMDITVRG